MAKILLIDDFEDNLITLQALIKELFPKIQILNATNGFTGIELAKAEQPDVILLDILMPDLDGFQVCQILKEEKTTNDIPVVFVTALKETKENRIKALKVGVEGFLTKPVDETELEAQVKAMLKIKEANDLKRYEKEQLEKLVDERNQTLRIELNERKKAEDALAISEEKYCALYNNAPLAYQALNAEGFIIDINPSWLHMLGYERDEVIGKWFGDFLAPEDVSQFEKNFPIFKKQGYVHDVQFCMLGKDQTKIFTSYEGRVGYDSNGRFRQTYCTFKDITQSKDAEDKLAKAAINWNATFDALNDGMIILDHDQNVVQCNKKVIEILNTSVAKIVGKKCYLNVHQTDCRILECPFTRMEISRQRETMQMPINNRIYEVITDPIFNLQGAIDGAVHILKDITEYVKVKEEILKERRLLRTLIDNLPSQIYVKDKDGRKILSNKADYEAIGVSKEEEVLGKTDLELFEGLIGERGVNDDMQVIQTGKPIIDKEEYFVNAKGIISWKSTSKIPLNDSNGNIIGLVGIGHNITESKKVLKELTIAKNKAEESDRLKSAFLANMSHEIRTPMNGILGFLELLKEPELEETEKNSYIEIVNQSGERLLNTINDIIKISKIEAGDVPVVISPIELQHYLRYYHDFFSQQANKKGLQLILQNNETEVINFYCDKNKLDSIFTNLIKNAIKFTDTGTITFGFTKKAEHIEFFVKDTGIGIPVERREAIFDRFVQADIGDKRAFQGSGLGLSIVKAYIEILNGKIWLESTEHQGTTFFFSLPYKNKTGNVVELKSEELIEKNQSLMVNQIKKAKILIAEDDEMSSFIIEIILKAKNYEIIKSVNGEETVNLCQNTSDIDLILMDLKMPIMNGYEATRKIREFNKELIIIAQTAFALSGDREKAIDAGCNDYIAKPIKKDKLLELLQFYLGK